MTRAEFERAFAALVTAAARPTTNSGLVACTECTSCTDCTFCVRCRDTHASHYCEDVSSSRELRHCKRTEGSARASHLRDCVRCTGSAYLAKCTDCVNCTYCFGCVGLQGKDFHILNEPQDRETYFRTAAQLARELRVDLP